MSDDSLICSVWLYVSMLTSQTKMKTMVNIIPAEHQHVSTSMYSLKELLAWLQTLVNCHYHLIKLRRRTLIYTSSRYRATWALIWSCVSEFVSEFECLLLPHMILWVLISFPWVTEKKNHKCFLENAVIIYSTIFVEGKWCTHYITCIVPKIQSYMRYMRFFLSNSCSCFMGWVLLQLLSSVVSWVTYHVTKFCHQTATGCVHVQHLIVILPEVKAAEPTTTSDQQNVSKNVYVVYKNLW